MERTCETCKRFIPYPNRCREICHNLSAWEASPDTITIPRERLLSEALADPATRDRLREAMVYLYNLIPRGGEGDEYADRILAELEGEKCTTASGLVLTKTKSSRDARQ